MADLKGTGVELVGLPQRDVGIGATVSTPLIPTADVAPVTSKAASPIEQRLLDILGDDFTGVGSGDSKVTVGQKMSEATKSGSRRARGLRLLEEGFEGQDKKAEITAAFDHAKHEIAREKADIEKVAAKQKRIKEDFVIRSQEINVGVSNALRLAQLGRNDEASKILTDMVNASTQKEGVKTVITGIDPQSSKIQGFTQPVDEQGNAIGEPLPLRADSTLMNTFRGVDLSSAFTLSEQARQEAVATARGEQAGVEQALGRQETQEEREIRAGTVTPVKRVAQGGEGAFTTSGKNIEGKAKAAGLQSSLDNLKPLKELVFGDGGKVDRGMLATAFANVPLTEGRSFNAVAKDTIESVIRIESGAAVPEPEITRASARYIPSVLDNDDTINLKMALLEQRVTALNAAVGNLPFAEGTEQYQQAVRAVHNTIMNKPIHRGELAEEEGFTDKKRTRLKELRAKRDAGTLE